MAEHRGSVAWFNNSKGYGFLSYDRGPDVFVHYSAITAEGYKKLKDGATVEFDIVKDSNGKLQAANVYVVSNT